MDYIPKPTGFLNLKMPTSLIIRHYPKSEWYGVLRNNLIEWACKRNINKIVCPNNLCFLFSDYKPGKGDVQIEFSNKHSNLIFIGDEVIEVID